MTARPSILDMSAGETAAVPDVSPVTCRDAGGLLFSALGVLHSLPVRPSDRPGLKTPSIERTQQNSHPSPDGRFLSSFLRVAGA